MKQSIEVHIEELVLHGVAVSDRHALSDWVGQELQRLILEQGMPRGLASDMALRNLSGGEIRLSQTPVAAQVGKEIARSVYSSLNGTSVKSAK